jgi:4-coumarate--CoA ligase
LKFCRSTNADIQYEVIFQDADTNHKFTFGEVRASAIEFGKGLKSLFDFRKGDVLGVFSPNCVDTPAITFGALWAGVIVSPANPGYTVKELAYQLEDSSAKAIVTQLATIDTVREACAKVGIPEDHIILIGGARDPTGKFKHWTSIRNISGTTRYRQAKISPKSDLAFLVYSSGTTGTPKGVKLSHYNLTSNMLQLNAGEYGNLTWDGSGTSKGIPLPKRGSGGDKILACLPFFHIYGLLTTVLLPVYSGVQIVVLAQFEIEKFCRLIQHHGITYIYVVPPMCLLLSKHPCVDNYDLSSLRMTTSGAAPLTKELVEAMHRRTGIKVKQAYGLSETSPSCVTQPWDEWDKSVGSIGKLLPNLEAKFCAVPGSGEDHDPNGKAEEVAPGETGELYVRGPNIFLGYHGKLEATRECLDREGWFRTGDVGYVDGRGDIYITDRVKELIKYKGFQVPPAELEGYLVDHDWVDDVAVVGVESQELGTEVPRAYVVRKGGMKAVKEGEAEGLVRWLNERVANHKKLRGGLRFVDAVPKSASGKILRRILKEEARKEYAELEKKGNLKAKL